MPSEYAFDVFLSYAKPDALLAEQLARSLTATGMRVWFDRWELVPRQPWQEAVKDAIEKSATAIVCIGSSSTTMYQRHEFQPILGNAQSTERSCVIIPVLLPGADERFVPDSLRHLAWIDMSKGIDDPDKLAHLVAFIHSIGRGEEIDTYEDEGHSLAMSYRKVGDGFFPSDDSRMQWTLA